MTMEYPWCTLPIPTHRRVNTCELLKKRRLNCCLCRSSWSILEHLFVHCPVALCLWHLLFRAVKVCWVMISNGCHSLLSERLTVFVREERRLEFYGFMQDCYLVDHLDGQEHEEFLQL